MVVQPRLVGVLLRGRSAWKGLAETDYFALQHHPRRISNAFRIITRGFPHYRVAEGDSVELLQEELEFLSRMARVSIQGKITSKKISTWLKSTFERNSILAIEPPEDRLTQPLDRQGQLDRHRLNDPDGYLSDSSFISTGEITDSYTTNLKTRRPLRRAISLEDLSIIHRHLRSPDLTSQIGPKKATTLPEPSEVSNQRLLQLVDPVERPASSASLYHRRQRSRGGAAEMEESISPVNVDESYDHGDNGGLPTPDVSPEELSESSEELVIIQGDLLEESRSKSEDRVRQFHYGSFPEDGVDAAATGEASANAGAMVGSFSWLTESPFIDALVNWIEGPETSAQQRNTDKDKPNPWLDIPLQFIALLTYPEPDPKNGNKMSLAMVRETAFVRQRRKTLMMLTAYTLVVRYCSFDSFLAILFASNCAMLFLMKNSGRMNVNMAKRAVRQRVGWAKQWAGGIFRRGGGGGNANTSGPSNNNNNSNSNRIGSGGSQYHGVTANSPPSPIINRQMQSSPVPVDVAALTVENSPLMKRRGLFGKRKTVDNHGSSHIASSSSSQVFTTSLAPSSQGRYPRNGDGASILSAAPTMATAGTQKKRFFRRGNTTNSNSNNSSITVVAPTPSAPVTIPSKRSTSSTVSHPSAQHAGTSTPVARTTITNTPLSTSPLVQSQSLPHYRFSPLKSSTSPVLSSNESDMDKMDSRWPIMSRSITPTPPPLLPVTHSAQQSKGASLSSPDTSSSGDSTPSSSESVSVPTQASAPLMVSGLSQLLGKDKAQLDSAHWEDEALRGGEEGNEEGRVNVDQDSARSNFTLDAVTSASAEAMEGV